MNFLGFGNGSDGDLNISTSVTDSPIDSSCSGTSGTNSLSATNASFTAGQFVLIIQSRGTGAGAYEVNKIDSYSTGTITTVHQLENTYTDSGASQAQVIVLKQYGNVNVTGTLTGKAWDGDKGGIVAFMAKGNVYGNGTISALGKGFRGGAGVSGGGVDGYQGESELGTGVKSYLANGSAGGGGDYLINQPSYGGGGGHATAGQTGPNDNNGAEGVGGGTTGQAENTTLFFGGSGGSASTGNDGSSASGTGGNGGGIIFIICKKFAMTGSLNASGAQASPSGLQSKGSGGGAGGSIVIKSISTIAGTSIIAASGGAGGDGAATSGGDGRIRIESCSITGSTTPTASTQGGQSYCSSLTFIQ